MTTENKVPIHFQMMLKNHFSCYAVIKATYQSFPSNTALDSVPMPAIWLTLSTSKYTQFHFMITNFHYLIAAYSVSLDMLFEYWYRYSLHMRKNKKEVLQTSLVFHCETFLLTGMLAHDEKDELSFMTFLDFFEINKALNKKLSAGMISWTVKICWKTTSDPVENGTHMQPALFCWIPPLLKKYSNRSWSLGSETIYFIVCKVLGAEKKIRGVVSMTLKTHTSYSPEYF